METAVELAREGQIVAMFPEGTRRTKGLMKTREARPRTGAARIALEAEVPLVPAVSGTYRPPRLGQAARRVRQAGGDRRPAWARQRARRGDRRPTG